MTLFSERLVDLMTSLEECLTSSLEGSLDLDSRCCLPVSRVYMLPNAVSFADAPPAIPLFLRSAQPQFPKFALPTGPFSLRLSTR
jgi:hypothetical protein